MAWIHPNINGDYRIIGVTSTTILNGNAGSTESVCNSEVQSDIASVPSLDSVIDSSQWLCLGTTATSVASTVYGTSSSDIYNPNGDLVGTSEQSLLNGSLTNAIEYRFDGTSYSGAVATGTYTGGGPPDIRIGGVSSYGGDSSSVLAAFFGGNGSQTGVLPLYGFSPDISTMSGSLSGTIIRSQTEIWAIGSITLTGDIDFGGDVDLKAALDGSQTPTFTGDYFIDVGSGGSIIDLGLPVKIKDSGTNNVTLGNVGNGIKVR